MVKLRQAVEAVAAMNISYSQGQTEGVNKPKLVKRSIYCRGRSDLLRQGVLYVDP